MLKTIAALMTLHPDEKGRVRREDAIFGSILTPLRYVDRDMQRMMLGTLLPPEFATDSLDVHEIRLWETHSDGEGRRIIPDAIIDFDNPIRYRMVVEAKWDSCFSPDQAIKQQAAVRRSNDTGRTQVHLLLVRDRKAAMDHVRSWNGAEKIYIRSWTDVICDLSAVTTKASGRDRFILWASDAKAALVALGARLFQGFVSSNSPVLPIQSVVFFHRDFCWPALIHVGQSDKRAFFEAA